MRILIAAANRGIVGGVETYLRVLIPALVARGHQIALLFENSCHDTAARVDPPDVPVWIWNSESPTESELEELIRWGPDVAYYHSTKSVETGSALAALVPTILYAHDYSGTCISGRKCHAFPRIEPCNRTFGPTCLALYYPRRCGGLNPLRALSLYRWQARRKAQLREFRMVLVASNHMRKELQNNGAYPEKLEVLSLPNTQRIPGTAPPAPRTHKGRILFVGRLTDVKGTRVLIEAIRLAEAALNHPLKLEIAGEGSERADLEQFAARTGVAAEFLGFLDSKAMHDAMSDADLLGVPSLWPEPFGLVGIEAGSLGLPAVGFAVGGIEEWLIPGKSGEVAPGDPPAAQGLADAIVRAFADPDHYNLLRRGAWDVSTQFTMDRHLDRLDDIWRLATAGVNEDNFHAAQAGEHYSM